MRKILISLCFVCVLAFLPNSQAFAQSGLLKQGMSGEGVSVLQTKLQEYGYYQGTVDGNFGVDTRVAVVRFQMDCGLEADGVVGDQTMQSLRDFKGSTVSRHFDRAQGQQVVVCAQRFLGVPYVWGGRSPGGFDCSGFVSYVLGQLGVNIPRMADGQFYAGVPVGGNDLQPGDLVFFSTYEPGPSHVGIYIGSGQFIHASSGSGRVVVTSLYSNYFQSRYLGARRFI